MMERVLLGRTGLTVSIAGIGTGGPSRIGRRSGSAIGHAIGLLHRAYELGVNYFDTSQTGDTEELIGAAFRANRDQVVISSKFRVRDADGDLLTRPGLRSALDRSLERLGTDHIDVYYVHSLGVGDYEYTISELVPELERLRDHGKIGAIGVSEQSSDTGHAMLGRAVEDDCWPVLMVTMNLFNQTAIDQVLPKASQHQTAIVVMAAARGVFSDRARFDEAVRLLAREGRLPAEGLDLADPLGFAFEGEGVASMADASYRFVRDTPGTSVVLVGTGSYAHLDANIASFEAAPLPPSDYQRMRRLFGRLCLPTSLD